jgi:glycosyltransferase involved in cell wall biosynthesis
MFRKRVRGSEVSESELIESTLAPPRAGGRSQEGHLPRVSLGLPVYNGSRFLRECMDSILTQTFGDFELIVCDNASTDDTLQILEDYQRRDSRISIHRAKSNQGAAPNFNWTFKLARGEFFKWCAADDVLEPTYLEQCVKALDAHRDVVLTYSGAVDIDEHSKKTREIYDNRVLLRFAAPEPHVRFQDLTCHDHSCIAVFGLVRRLDLAKTSLIGGYVGSDRTLLVELGLQGKLMRIGDDLLLHREHRGRSVNALDLRQRAIWFNTKARGPIFPYFRLLGEYFRAVWCSSLSVRQKVRCSLELVRWMKWGAWRGLLEDFTYYLKPSRS